MGWLCKACLGSDEKQKEVSDMLETKCSIEVLVWKNVSIFFDFGAIYWPV